MKRRELLNKHFFKNKLQISPLSQEQLSIFTLKVYGNYTCRLPKQPEFLFDQNKKHYLCRGLCPLHVCKVPVSSPLWLMRRFFKKLPFISPRQPIKLMDLGKMRMKREPYEPRHEKTGFFHVQKQRRRSASPLF